MQQQKKPFSHSLQVGFTLVEMAIVLVIIGLIVAGVLVGQDMISAANVRAQIAQIEKYKSAVNTFKSKYANQLPGDIDGADATAFGFAARGSYYGEGDGNGIIEGIVNITPNHNNGIAQGAGETSMFWVDLSQANLIDGSFNTAASNAILVADVTPTSSPNLSAFFPPAKIGSGNYVYIFSGGYGTAAGGNHDGYNYFGIENISSVASISSLLQGSSTIPVIQAYNIDSKIDDGLPQSGTILAQYVRNGFVQWASNSSGNITSPPFTTATTATGDVSCFDNGMVAGATQKYSTQWKSGAEQLCALSFRF